MNIKIESTSNLKIPHGNTQLENLIFLDFSYLIYIISLISFYSSYIIHLQTFNPVKISNIMDNLILCNAIYCHTNLPIWKVMQINNHWLLWPCNLCSWILILHLIVKNSLYKIIICIAAFKCNHRIWFNKM